MFNIQSRLQRMYTQPNNGNDKGSRNGSRNGYPSGVTDLNAYLACCEKEAMILNIEKCAGFVAGDVVAVVAGDVVAGDVVAGDVVAVVAGDVVPRRFYPGAIDDYLRYLEIEGMELSAGDDGVISDDDDSDDSDDSGDGFLRFVYGRPKYV